MDVDASGATDSRSAWIVRTVAGAVLLLTPLAACGDRSGSAAHAAADSPETLPPEAAAIAAWSGPVIWGVPRPPSATEATGLVDSMRAAWTGAGEPPELFEARLGETILVTGEPFDRVRDFYLPFMTKVFMDHEMEVPGAGPQRMLTGLVTARDGTLVKLTVTRPFFRYPDRARIDRTAIQIGRVGRTP